MSLGNFLILALCAGAIRVPALLAVHESAPVDPSIPLQRAQPQTQGPLPSQPKRKATRAATSATHAGKQATASTGKRASIEDESAPKLGFTTVNAVTSDGGSSSSFSSSDATGTSGWGFRQARPPGYRQTVAQTPDGQQAGSIAAEDKQEARLEEWPYFWYPPQQLIGLNRGDEFAEEQRSVAEQILHQKQQQKSGGVEAASQQAPFTRTASSRFQAASKTEDLLLDSPRQSAKPGSQQPVVSMSSAGARDTSASGYLPKLDLLAQFSESISIAEDHVSHVLDDATAAEDSAAAPGEDAADTAPAGCNQGLAESDEGEFRMMANLNGAQVLTSDGWQSISSRTPLGTAWEQGNCLTIGMTLQYHVSASSGQIAAVTCGWATLDAYAWTIQDMMSLYIRCTGLHKW